MQGHLKTNHTFRTLLVLHQFKLVSSWTLTSRQPHISCRQHAMTVLTLYSEHFSRAVSRCMGTTIFGLDWVSLAVLYWVVYAFSLEHFANLTLSQSRRLVQPIVQGSSLFSVIGQETCHYPQCAHREPACAFVPYRRWHSCSRWARTKPTSRRMTEPDR